MFSVGELESFSKGRRTAGTQWQDVGQYRRKDYLQLEVATNSNGCTLPILFPMKSTTDPQPTGLHCLLIPLAVNTNM